MNNYIFRFLIGVRLLKAMGWREGQGIGPRVSKIQSEETGKAIINLINLLNISVRT
jgi:hypothetical protein